MSAALGAQGRADVLDELVVVTDELAGLESWGEPAGVAAVLVAALIGHGSALDWMLRACPVPVLLRAAQAADVSRQVLQLAREQAAHVGGVR